MRPSLRRRAPIVAAVLVAIAIAAPLGAFASHQFADVPDSNQFHADIDAVADAGVTTGCGGSNYCPSAFVTREQMAAFMNRLGALAPSKTPVVNADKVDGYHANGLTRVASASYTGDALMDGDLVTSGTLISTTISAPSAGYLVATARVDGWLELAESPAADTVSCEMTVGGDLLAGSRTYIVLSLTDFEEDCVSGGTTVVCAAGDYTVALVAGTAPGTNESSALKASTNLGNTFLQVQFVPFDADGAAAACITGGPSGPVAPEGPGRNN